MRKTNLYSQRNPNGFNVYLFSTHLLIIIETSINLAPVGRFLSTNTLLVVWPGLCSFEKRKGRPMGTKSADIFRTLFEPFDWCLKFLEKKVQPLSPRQGDSRRQLII